MRLPSHDRTPPSVPGEETSLARRLAASVAHHVNNALTGVIANLELALQPGDAASEQTAYLRAGLACALRAAEAVRGIVSFACHGPRTDALTIVSLRSLAERAAAELHARAGSEVTIRVTGDPRGEALGSEPLLRSALGQVLSNALEALSPNGGTIELTIEDEEGRPCLRVRDSGPGIPDEVQERLFEPFVTTKPGGHLGLGLALCRELLAAQAGSVHVTAAPGEGTTVTLALTALVPAGPRGPHHRSGRPLPHANAPRRAW
jgi:signal transduction histidine kinase